MATKKMQKLVEGLENRLKSYGELAPDIHDIVSEMKTELARAQDEQGEDLPDLTELPPTPLDSMTSVKLKISNLLVGRGQNKFPEFDAKILLSAVWRKHAGKHYHMRWGNENEMEVSLGDVIKFRLERMRDGVRLRFLAL